MESITYVQEVSNLCGLDKHDLSLNDLSESVLRRLTRIKGVNSIRSNIVLQNIKSSTELPLAQVA